MGSGISGTLKLPQNEFFMACWPGLQVYLHKVPIGLAMAINAEAI